MAKKESRQRHKRLQVRVLPAEEAEIKINAKNCGLSVADYLRKLGLHYQPKTILDHKSVIELSQVNGDLGRLGGLLKLWLTNKEKVDSLDKAKINLILVDIKKLQDNLVQIAKRI